MKIIYKANDILEAHIVAGMLRAHEIEAYVGGHYLQGAVGELSPCGIANVYVNDEDINLALTMMHEYETNGEGNTADESLFTPGLSTGNAI